MSWPACPNEGTIANALAIATGTWKRYLTLHISGDKVDTELPLMPLHRVWPCMFEQRKNIFDIRVRGPEGAIGDFWTEVSITDPKWFAWPRLLSLRPMRRPHCTPYALHGDAVPVFKGKSLYVVSACSILGSGTSIDVKNVEDVSLEPHEKKNKP